MLLSLYAWDVQAEQLLLVLLRGGLEEKPTVYFFSNHNWYNVELDN